MKLETKFDINNKVYFLKDNKIKEGEVRSIHIEISATAGCYHPDFRIVYYISYDPNVNGAPSTYREEKDIFESKEDLLTYLRDH